jgi:hypothetical protein
MVQTRVRINLCDQAPTLQDETQITDVLATPVIRPQIELFFPGNIVSGLFSRDQRTSVPLREAMANSIDPAWPLRPLGTAVTVTTDGYVEGRGAPPFVTRIFPGLNLTRYKYNTMTGFAEYKADGSADNDMIFSGQHYDMYIEGVTDPHHWGQYDIGLALGGSAQWNHTWKQGRIPLLKFKARIEDGRFYDEEVSYPWPNETLFKIFLENNIVYRMWVNRQKQEAH